MLGRLTRAVLGRRFLWSASALILAGVALHVVNAARFDRGAGSAAAALLERAQQTAEKARKEYQELALARLPGNPNNGAFFRFDDNYLSATQVEKPEAAEAVSEYLAQWEFDGSDSHHFVTSFGQSGVEQRDGSLVVSQRGSDRLINEEPLRIPLRDVSELIVRAKADRGNRFLFSWAPEDNEDLLNRNNVSLDLIADGEFHTYVVDARSAFARPEAFYSNLSKIAITPSNANGASVEIDYIRITSKLARYRTTPTGTAYQTIGNEMRPALYLVPDQKLEFSIRVPDERPVMSFGLSTLTDEQPLALTVSVTANGQTATLLDNASASAQKWTDSKYDLSAWSGQDVAVSFDVHGSDANVMFLSSPVVRSAPERHFNVIIILEDALRADHLSTYGYERETSPFKTRFMRDRGVIFLNAHSQATQTRPSVPSLMTSLYPTATGVLNFSHALSDRYLTLAEILRAQGFETASFIQNLNAGPMAGLHQGFDRLIASDRIDETTESLFGDRTLDWIDEHRDENFFLYLHAKDPHGVYDPPAPFDEFYKEPGSAPATQGDVLEPSYLDPPWLKEPTAEARRRLYDGEIRHNDSVIESFIAELDERGLLDDTLLVFTADHGEWLGERGNWDHHPPGLSPVVHIPLMMSYPGLSEGGVKVEQSVQLIDVMPTILELAGVDTDDLLMQGDSLVSLVQGRDLERWNERITISEEPVIMTRGSPCACGSFFIGDWQVHGSANGVSPRLGALGREIVPFLETSTLRFKEDGLNADAGFSADLRVRMLRQHLLSGMSSADIELWRRITAGETLDEYRMDPEALERLRGLGYVH